MKISYNWLKEHLPLSVPAADLSKHLLQLGFEVASLEHTGPSFSGVVTAKVVDVQKHPNADRLSLCTVDDGSQQLAVVCGAPNVAAGQTVALAKVGAVLPGDFKITKSKIRGVESNGMICSAKELGLGEGGGGILVLDASTTLGQDYAATLGPGDDLMEVEITPNRPDCLSHLGLARELASFFRLELKAPAPAAAPKAGPLDVPVEVRAPQACTRYLGRTFEGVVVGPSPSWLAAKLTAVGLRPINNLVDITNYVLMDLGQPLHVFDADKLEGGKLIVRYAEGGETLKALDGKDYALNPSILVIADAKRPVAIAGVMGGADSAVSAATKRVFLESGHFLPPVVRKASQSLRLRSDSSYRFERGTDIAAVQTASERAAALIAQLAQGRTVGAADYYPDPAQPAPIAVTAARLSSILGAPFPPDAVQNALKAISARLDVEGDQLKFTPPTWRGDLTTVWDLAEEVGRLLSYENIPSKASPVALKPSRALPSQLVAERCARRLAALGLFEAYNYDFVSDKLLAKAGLSGAFARMRNPLSEDWAALRPTLLIGLLQNAALNLNRGAESVRLFELGKVYQRRDAVVSEGSRVAGLLLGPAAEPDWRLKPRALDFYDVKGLVAELLGDLPGLEWLPLDADTAGRTAGDPLFHPKASLRLVLPKGILGTVGVLHPSAARAWEISPAEPLLFDLDLDLLSEIPARQTGFKPYSPFPHAQRDLSFLVESSLPYAAVEQAVSACALTELEDLRLVDKFTGQGVPEGRQSLTIRLRFGRPDRTLKDAEVVAAVERVLAELTRRHGAILRS
ncbi:MAG: phenylalanine--tRNA ligase subunit beta [Elusimicrobiota bacterium]